MSRELEKISEVLDENPQILDLLLHDLCDTDAVQRGAGGMSADPGLRAAIIKQMHGCSYEHLAFLLVDSNSFRTFVRLPMGWAPSKSTLQRNIARISASTWKQVNQILLGWAADQRLEKGKKIRVDSTAVASDIHHPTDSELLNDCVRTIARLLKKLKERQEELRARGETAVELLFTDHTRRAKKRRYEITNRRGDRRIDAYRDLLKVARRTYDYGRDALRERDRHQDPESVAPLAAIDHYLLLMEQVIDQTERRILDGESVPAKEKVLSIFEEHTDIIKKGQ